MYDILAVQLFNGLIYRSGRPNYREWFPMDPKSASGWEQTFEYVPLTVCTTNQGKE
jgi:hypothetical protein